MGEGFAGLLGDEAWDGGSRDESAEGDCWFAVEVEAVAAKFSGSGLGNLAASHGIFAATVAAPLIHRGGAAPATSMQHSAE